MKTMIAKDIWSRLVKMTFTMVMDGANLHLAVAAMARTNGLTPAEAVRLLNDVKNCF